MFLTGWLIVLAVLVFWAVGAYNRLVRLRSAAIQAFGALDAELLRRTALLGEYDAVVSGPRVPRDAQLHEALRASGTQYAASLAVMRSRPLAFVFQPLVRRASVTLSNAAPISGGPVRGVVVAWHDPSRVAKDGSAP